MNVCKCGFSSRHLSVVQEHILNIHFANSCCHYLVIAVEPTYPKIKLPTVAQANAMFDVLEERRYK